MIATLATLAFPAVAHAADFHLTPDGAGKRDGSSWQDAVDKASLVDVFNERMQPGDRLLLGSGTYANASLTISKGGAPGRPKQIVGVDRGQGLPVFTGKWSAAQPTKGGVALRIGPGASYTVIEGLRLTGYVTGVQASEAEPARSHIVFKDVDIEQMRHGYYLSDCDDLQLIDCDLKRYTKHGFRLEQGCDGVTFRRCTADCSEGDAEWEKITELFPFGFNVNDGGAPNTKLVFEDCLAQNNLMPLQKTRYKNGDGFVMEANTSDVSLVRCRAIRNQDGGFDLKIPDLRLEGCVAVGNSRNFRIWSTATLTNCFAGWGTTGLWVNGGPVTATRCTFHANARQGVLTDDRATEPVTLIDCIISDTPRPTDKTARGEVKLQATVVAETGKPTDAKYTNADPRWNGIGDAMNSAAHPDKGYHAKRGEAPP